MGTAPEELLAAVRAGAGVVVYARLLTATQARQAVGDRASAARATLSSLADALPGAGSGGASGGAGEEAGKQPPPPPPPPAASRLQRARALARSAVDGVVHAVRAEVKLALMDAGDAAAARAAERAAARPGPAPGVPLNRGESGVVVVKPPPASAWQRRWGALAASPLVARLGATIEPAVARTRAAAGELRERWETSDSAVVHRLQDAADALRLDETPAARAFAAIQRAQPGFDMHEFVATVRRDVRPLLGAYLAGDVTALAAAPLAPELRERLGGLMAAWKAEGSVMDAAILDVSDVEVLELKTLGGRPVVVLAFAAQQINCVRNAAGAVIEGAADDIQAVHYAWAMEQVPATGEQAAPTWQLKDMLVRGMISVAA